MNHRMQRRTALLRTACLAFLLGLHATLHAALIVDQSLVLPAPDRVVSTLDDQVPPNGVESADNFTLLDAVELTSVAWWGAYEPAAPLVGDDFALRIFGGTGAVPGTAPIAEFLSIDVTRVATGELDGLGAPVFRYSTGAVAGLVLDPGTYYLSLVNSVLQQQNPLTWFWSQGQGGDEINWVREPSAGPAWGVSVAEIDLAFQIEGDVAAVVPVPGTALLLLPALLLLRSARRSAGPTGR